MNTIQGMDARTILTYVRAIFERDGVRPLRGTAFNDSDLMLLDELIDAVTQAEDGDDRPYRVRASCGCTLSEETNDRPPCDVCGQCEVHCPCVCEQCGQAFKAMETCMTCEGGSLTPEPTADQTGA